MQKELFPRINLRKNEYDRSSIHKSTFNETPTTMNPSPSETNQKHPYQKRTSFRSDQTEDRKEAIASKFPKRITDILMTWVIHHMEHPYPSQTDIDELIRHTGLNQSQVTNWTRNIRKRNIKATIEGKKPHHYIDFLALVYERDRKREKQCVAGPTEDVGNDHEPVQNLRSTNARKMNSSSINGNRYVNQTMSNKGILKACDAQASLSSLANDPLLKRFKQATSLPKDEYHVTETSKNDRNICFDGQEVCVNNLSIENKESIGSSGLDVSCIFEQYEAV